MKNTIEEHLEETLKEIFEEEQKPKFLTKPVKIL
jgi:hypothetical protein